MDTEEPAPPLFKSWRRAYAVVLIWLAVQVAIFSWVSGRWP